MIAQSSLIVLMLVVSLFALAKLHLVSKLNTEALTVDSACINEEKRLLKSFLAEMRNGEKFGLTRDQSFYEAYTKSNEDFQDALAKINGIIDTDREKELTTEIGILHTVYSQEIDEQIAGRTASDGTKSKASESIIERANDLIRLREQSTSAKTALARDHASSSADVMFWLMLSGIAGALFFAFVHARGVSRPLKKLAREMGHVGKGEFRRSPQLQGPREIEELAAAFNRMSEELERLDRLKSDFTAHVSHELRTPLTAIREGTALLLEGISGPLTDNQREILEVVRNHSQRLFQSITSILDLSKMEAEMMDYEFTMCDLGDVVENSVQAVDLIARKRSIEIRTNLPLDLPMLYADERRVQQVLDNLLSNALKFSPEGVEIGIDAFVRTSGSGQGREVEICVSDKGPGIPKEELQKVFKHFYQGSNHRSQQGTGLGLAIARHIVEAHKGRIWADSEIGKGAVFHFTLPVAAVPEPVSYGSQFVFPKRAFNE